MAGRALGVQFPSIPWSTARIQRHSDDSRSTSRGVCDGRLPGHPHAGGEHRSLRANEAASRESGIARPGVVQPAPWRRSLKFGWRGPTAAKWASRIRPGGGARHQASKTHSRSVHVVLFKPPASAWQTPDGQTRLDRPKSEWTRKCWLAFPVPGGLIGRVAAGLQMRCKLPLLPARSLRSGVVRHAGANYMASHADTP